MDAESADLLEHVLVPVATPEDAEATARELAAFDPGQVTVMHVVEKGGGAPDKTPVVQSEEIAKESYDAAREHLPDAESHTAYDNSVVSAIFNAATKVDASAIAYRSRGGGRLMHFLSGDLSLKLVTKAPIPVIALPRTDEE